jgi:type VI secretion system secreted protein Hcp
MLIEIRYTDRNGIPHLGGKNPIHGLKLGPKDLTPRNVAQEIQFESVRDAASGLPSGKRQHKPITITQEIGASTPNLFSAASRNEVFSAINLNFLKASNPAQPETLYYTITLTNALVTGYRRRHTEHGKVRQSGINTREVEEFDLVFQQITFTNVTGSKTASDDWLSG